MREIKFRAWDKDEKRMLYTDWGSWRNWYDESVGGRAVYSRNHKFTSEPMQYTGLKDKNGKEIYEGDIFDCIYKFDGCEHKLVVVWSDENASFRLKNYGECDQPYVSKAMFDLERLEVIGNIYENKELLK